MRQLFEQTRAAALKQGLKDYAAASTNDEAELEAEFDDVAQARKKAELAFVWRPIRLTRKREPQ